MSTPTALHAPVRLNGHTLVIQATPKPFRRELSLWLLAHLKDWAGQGTEQEAPEFPNIAQMDQRGAPEQQGWRLVKAKGKVQLFLDDNPEPCASFPLADLRAALAAVPNG